MKTQPKRYAIRLTDADRVFQIHLANLAGQSRETWHMNRRTIRRFLTDAGASGRPQSKRLLLDEAWLLQWMIRDCAGRTPRHAMQRLGVISRYLRALTDAGVLETDLMVELRTRHGHVTLERLVQVLQSANPQAALAALYTAPAQPGPLCPFIAPYLELHQSLGKHYKAHRLDLRALDRFLQAQGVPSVQAITPALLERWIAPMTCLPIVRLRKANLVKRFFDYLRALQVIKNNPMPLTLLCVGKQPETSCKPFIFSSEQIAAILACAKQLPKTGFFPERARTCYTMLAFLYALGLRHGELLRLRLRDLDLDRQTLFVDQTKFHKSRYVPFGPNVGRCLADFLAVRRTVLQPLRPDDPIFVTLWRSPLSSGTLLAIFRTIIQALKITGTPGQRLPRLHDLRHTFAVHRLLRWYREGVDVQSRLSDLATFMGHVDLKNTQIYLTATADLLREANDRFYRHFGSALDEEKHA